MGCKSRHCWGLRIQIFFANSVLGAAVSRWVKEGQNDQLDSLLRSLPGVTVQRADIIYAQVGSGTAPKDPSGGLALLLNIQDPAARNRWLSNTAATLASTAPSSAMDYVLAISDPATRETRAKRIYSQWAAKDAEAARNKIEVESFPPDLKNVLLGTR